jgi:lipopolysaccharide/colanic/teichoic acid biosynthesis glycosyltransferase
VIALGCVLVLLPLLIVIALGVRLSSPGPVLFRQRRVGRDGRHFNILSSARCVSPPRASRGTSSPPGSAPGGVEGTDRRTRIGRLLRASSLDELPQLINVLRGQMSLVGPRPERLRVRRKALETCQATRTDTVFAAA